MPPGDEALYLDRRRFSPGLERSLHRQGRIQRRTSPLTEIPDFVLNAPPNHLSWWDEGALRAVAGSARCEDRSDRKVPFSFDSVIYWMARCAPKLTRDRYFQPHWTCALAWSWLVGRACDALFRVPASARPSGLLLIARKPS
jgi:hypothetical protein